MRISVNGPESTGKTTLSKALAEKFGGIWLPEYAREYLQYKGLDYNMEDVLTIARRQVELEYELASKGKALFIDTDLIVTKVWLQHLYGSSPEWIDEKIRTLPRDLCLLCYYDLPWESDPLRENPHLREYLFNWYKKELDYYRIAYFVVDGVGDHRFAKACARVEQLM